MVSSGCETNLINVHQVAALTIGWTLSTSPTVRFRVEMTLTRSVSNIKLSVQTYDSPLHRTESILTHSLGAIIVRKSLLHF